MLEAGAKVLQNNSPVAGFDVYLVGFHPIKEHPEHQMVAHHYCHQMNEDFAQCILFDSNTKNANMNGVEYIISEKLFGTLPAGEKKFWHPHNGEILSGQLMAPGIPKVAEKALMKSKMNSYGKTWHVWSTGQRGQQNDVAVSQPGASSILAATNPAVEAPRSSNLRLTREFSDLDRDEFIHGTFDYIGKFFESSLAELASRHLGIKGRYQRIDTRQFTAFRAMSHPL